MRQGLTTQQRALINYHTILMIPVLLQSMEAMEAANPFHQVVITPDRLTQAADHAYAADSEVVYGSSSTPQEKMIGWDVMYERAAMCRALVGVMENTGRSYLTTSDLRKLIRYFNAAVAPYGMLIEIRRAIGQGKRSQ